MRKGMSSLIFCLTPNRSIKPLYFRGGSSIVRVSALGLFLGRGNRLKMWNRLKNFFAEARQELRHVNWPTRQEAVRLTGIVIGISVGIAVFLAIFDYLFTYVLQILISK